MRRHFKGRRRHRGRSWGAVGNEVASAGWRATEKAAEGLGRWMVTDHTGLGQRLSNLPSGMGILETFTVLYAPPDGFRSPLTFGFVRTEPGERVMACNPDYRSPKKLKMGGKVYLKMREGLYVFEKYNLWTRLKRWLKGPPKD